MTLTSGAAEIVASVLAANGDAKSITIGPEQTAGWNTGTGTGGGDIRSAGTTLPGKPTTTVCQTLQGDKPWALVGVPLRPAVAL
jgi:hypothetical protein